MDTQATAKVAMQAAAQARLTAQVAAQAAAQRVKRLWMGMRGRRGGN